jgi:hypothetical protein
MNHINGMVKALDKLQEVQEELETHKGKYIDKEIEKVKRKQDKIKAKIIQKKNE